LKNKAVTYTLSLTEENAVVLHFSTAIQLSASDLKVLIGGVEAHFTLEQLGPTEFTVLISDPSLLQDGADVSVILLNSDITLDESSAALTLPANSSQKSSEQSTADAIGSFTQMITAIILGAITVAGISSGNLSSTWILISSLQLLQYIPVMQLNLTLPLTELFKNLSFNFLPNPFTYFIHSSSATGPAQRMDFDTNNFALNFGDIASGLIVGVLMWPVCLLISELDFTVVSPSCRRAVSEYRWNYFIRFIVEAYCDLVFTAVVQVLNLSSSSLLDVISSSFAILSLGVCAGFAIFVLVFTARRHSQFNETGVHLEYYGSLFEEFKNDRGLVSCSCYGLFLVRRLFYMCILFLLNDYPVLQVCLNALHSICVSYRKALMHILAYFPFKVGLHNLTTLCGEAVNVIVFALTGVYLLDLSESQGVILQWVIIGAVYFMLLVNCIVSVCLTCTLYSNKVKKWRLMHRQVTDYPPATAVIEDKSFVLL
jgi:hypothetical protein